MRINAYTLCADPAWCEASVRSYYDIVDRIFLVYDQSDRGWHGARVHASECVERLQRIDHQNKLVLLGGDYVWNDQPLMECETRQRQIGLDAASENADWVLQFDTDEVLANPQVFLSCLTAANSLGHDVMDYPARWLYRRLDDTRFLEACSRWWGIQAGYPGPIAVRSRTVLRHARQSGSNPYRIDFRPVNTDPWRPLDSVVHRVIDENDGIFHLSMVREPEALVRKTSTFAHAKDRDWSPEHRRWERAGKRPYLTAMLTPLRRRSQQTHLRVARLPAFLPGARA